MKNFTPAQKRAIKNQVKLRLEEWKDKLEIHQEDLNLIRQYQKDGQIGISWSHTDCDMCRTTGVAIIPATVIHLRSWLNKFFDSSEGPTSWAITYPKEREATFRDLIAEAHEDGHPHLVCI